MVGYIGFAPPEFPGGLGISGQSEAPRVRNGGNAWTGQSGGAWRGRPAASDSASASAPGAVLMDRVTRVRDGDSIVVGLIPIRIANLDCAESGTSAGERATSRAKELIAGQILTCRLEGRRSYDREVGICTLEGGMDFGEVLIAEGYCSRWRK
ncbi:hypothetical protein [uncultured Paracoccus sp.]|uniref:thermonuclease family protein n=1 Tax=uncultured Paracoccus sp. TaxID=189685 RepID=UPI002612D38B|nr:hypothetical protein [uncultured Paracoccus sp.]